MPNDNILNSITLPQTPALEEIEAIEDGYRLFSSLTEKDKPLKPLPPDDLIEIYYDVRYEKRCVMCKSHFRTLAEHVYLINNMTPHAVMAFFKEYYNAKTNWYTINAHMKKHCDFSKIDSSGLQKLKAKQGNALEWQYREFELATVGILDEIDELKGINTSRIDLKLKIAELLRKFYGDLVQLREKQNQGTNATINIQKVLMDIWKEMIYEEDKLVIIRKVQEVQQILSAK